MGVETKVVSYVFDERADIAESFFQHTIVLSVITVFENLLGKVVKSRHVSLHDRQQVAVVIVQIVISYQFFQWSADQGEGVFRL